jgi:hypothetical protein
MSAECEALAEAEAEAQAGGANEPGGGDELAGDGGGDDAHIPSSLDLILDMLYQRCSLYELEGVAHKKAGLRRMWRSTFGRLPPPSQLALRYAPGTPAVAAPSSRPVPPPACRGRLRVPPPPSQGRGRSMPAGWTKLN